MTTDSFEYRLLQHISKQNNLSLQLESEVTNRRGAKMLKVLDGDQLFGLKITTDSETSLSQETQVLQSLPEFTQHLYVDSGCFESSEWLLQHWIEGQSVHSYIKKLPDDSERNSYLLQLFISMFAKIAELHKLGYLHGDLQPAHFRMNNNSIFLLDFAMTHRMNEPFDYRGAFVHFSAPEICDQQLAERYPVSYDEQSELYSLASTIFFLYTEQISPNYGNEGMKANLKQKLERISQGHRNTFSNTECQPFEALERILEKCLAFNKEERYVTVAEALQDLYALQAEY